jgi:hypothetical protein
VVSEPSAGVAVEHPGPAVARLPRPVADAIVAQARAEYPNEACGLIVGSAPAASGGEALRYEACRNKAASPFRYEIHPDDLFLTVAVDDADEGVLGDRPLARAVARGAVAHRHRPRVLSGARSSSSRW